MAANSKCYYSQVSLFHGFARQLPSEGTAKYLLWSTRLEPRLRLHFGPSALRVRAYVRGFARSKKAFIRFALFALAILFKILTWTLFFLQYFFTVILDKWAPSFVSRSVGFVSMQLNFCIYLLLRARVFVSSKHTGC